MIFMSKTIKLKLRKTFFLKPTAPFSFDKTIHKPDHFTSGDNIWQPGIRWQTWRWRGVPLGLKIENSGSVNKPLVKIGIYTSPNLFLNSQEFKNRFFNDLIGEVSYFYNFNLDLKEFYRLFGKDRKLGRVIKRMRGMRPGQPSSLYEYLIVGIVLQNASVRRSINMFRTLLENFGTQVKFGRKELWCFWPPGGLKNVSELKLRKLKLGYRAKSIKKIDDYFGKKLINEFELREQPCETQRRELLALYGVGPATVWYILFDVFHRWDVFDHISPWEQKIYSKLWFGKETTNPVSVDKLLRFINKYGKYKHLAVHYFWEDLWWQHKEQQIDWLRKEIRA